MILAAAKEYDIKVHLGLAFPLQIESTILKYKYVVQYIYNINILR